MKETKKYTLEEWKAEGNRLFGDVKQWRMKCPSCGHVQTMQDFIDLGVEEPETKFHFSCIGRWMPDNKKEMGDNTGGPCNYTLGGLFVLNKVTVIAPDNTEVPVFEFAEPVAVKNGEE